MAGLNAKLQVDANDAKREIKSFNDQLKHSEKILKITTEKLKTQGDAAELLATKKDALNKQIKLQTEISERHHKIIEQSKNVWKSQAEEVEKLKKAYEESIATKGKTDEATEKLAKSLEIAKKGLEAAAKNTDNWKRKLEISEAETRLLYATLAKTTQGINEQTEAVNSQTVGLSRLGSELMAQTENVSIFGDVLKANLVADAITGAFRSISSNISGYLSEGAKMADQFAISQGQLELVMRNTMGAADEQVEAIRELANAQQELGIVSQNAQLAGAQQLSVNLQNKESLQALIPAMNDLAVQQHGINAGQQQVTRIAMQMTQVLGGNVNAMRRLGFVFNEAQQQIIRYGSEAERVAMLVEVITNSVGGMNRALAETDVGRQVQLNNVLAETQMRIGEVWNSLRAEFSAEMLPHAEAFFSDLLRVVEENRDSIAGLMGILQGLTAFLLNNARNIAHAIAAVGGAIAAMRVTEAIRNVQQWITALQAAAATKTSVAGASQILAAANAANATAEQKAAAATLQAAAANTTKMTTVKALTAAMLKNPMFLGAVAVGGIVALVRVVGNLNFSLETQSQLVRELSDEFRRLESEAESTAREIQEIGRRIDELNHMGSLSLVDAQELAELKELNEQLALRLELEQRIARGAAENLARETIDLLTRQAGIFWELARNIRVYNDELEMSDMWHRSFNRTHGSMEERIAELGVRLFEYRENIKGVVDGYEEVVAEIDYFLETIQKMSAAWGEVTDATEQTEQGTVSATRLATASQQAAQSLVDLTNAYRAGEISGREYANSLREMLAETEKMAKLNPQMADEFNLLGESIRRTLSGSPEHLENLGRTMSNLAREVDTLRGALDEQNEAGELSVNTQMRLIEAGYAAALVIDQETGAVRLCTEAYIALAESRLAELSAEKEIARLELVQRLAEEEAVVDRVAQSHIDRATAVLHAAHAYGISTDATREQIAALEAQIRVIDQLRESLGTPRSHDRPGRGGNAARDAERDEENARREMVRDWERHYQERIANVEAYYDRRRFFNELSFEEEVQANERLLAYLREYYTEVESLEFATAEERANIRRDLARRIEQYERAAWTIQRNEQQELIRDEERAARRREELIQREIDAAQDNEARYQAYAAMRVAIYTRLYETLDSISERFWYNERDKLRAMEDAHWEFERNVIRINQRMTDLRREQLNIYVTEWRTAKFSQIDELRRNLELEHQARRDALTRELDMLRQHFAELDALERRFDRDRQIADLESEAADFSGAATREGQRHYRNLRDQIDRLRREDERDARNAARQEQEAAIRAQIDALDDGFQAQIEAIERQRESIQAQYEEMRQASVKLARDTKSSLSDAGEELASGLISMYDSFGDSIDKINDTQLEAGKELAQGLLGVYENLGIKIERLTDKQIAQLRRLEAEAMRVISRINLAFGTSRALTGTVINNNSTSTINFHDHGDKNFNNIQQAGKWWEMTTMEIQGLGAGM